MGESGDAYVKECVEFALDTVAVKLTREELRLVALDKPDCVVTPMVPRSLDLAGRVWEKREVELP